MKMKMYCYTELLAYQQGDFVDVEDKYLLEPSKYLRIQVDVDKTRPLHKEMCIKAHEMPK